MFSIFSKKMIHVTRVLIKSTTTSTFVYLRVQFFVTPDVFISQICTWESPLKLPLPIPYPIPCPAPPGIRVSSSLFCPQTNRGKKALPVFPVLFSLQTTPAVRPSTSS